MFRRPLILIALALALLGGSMALITRADAAYVNQPFVATGNVATTHSAFGPGTPVDGEIDAFLLNPVTSASTSATQYANPDGSLEIYVTPSTGYYFQDSSGAYRRSTYAETVVQGQSLKVVGDRYNRSDGTVRFIARFVYNPPPPDTSGPTYKPKCGTANNIRYTGFTVGATVVQKGIHYPCLTGAASNPLGFQVNGFTDAPQYLVTQAIQDFGNKLEIAIQPTTKYIKGGQTSTSDAVLKAGTGVRVFGNYLKLENGWVFTAKTVWTPDPNNLPAQPRRIDEYADSINQDPQSPGHYSGVVNRGQNAFLNGNFAADIVWSATEDGGWSASGTWTMTSVNGNDVLRGAITGQTSGINGLDLSLEVQSGEGQFYGVTGGGDFEGSYISTLGGQPASFGGHFILVVVPNPS